MEALAKSRDDFRVRRIDVGDGSSPVAKQYGIHRLPTLMLFKGDELVADDTGAVVRRLNSL